MLENRKSCIKPDGECRFCADIRVPGEILNRPLGDALLSSRELYLALAAIMRLVPVAQSSH